MISIPSNVKANEFNMHIHVNEQHRSDPAAGWGEGGGGWATNMKSVWPPLAGIFFMTYFYRGGGVIILSAPPDPLLTKI